MLFRSCQASSLPFTVSIVPAWSRSTGRGISMATNTLDTFYVLLTNVSQRSQAVFKPSNSWGFYALSFELREDDGHIVAISRKQTGFTRNMPSTFVIPPGEQMVFPIRLDDSWVAAAHLPIADEKPADITLKAIYEIKPTPEATQQSVWIGRIRSGEYHFQFRHWVN